MSIELLFELLIMGLCLVGCGYCWGFREGQELDRAYRELDDRLKKMEGKNMEEEEDV